MPIALLDERDKAEILGRLNKIDEILQTTTTQIDPIFANNSWELIKWVCQYDDPSRYWKVGDYKMVGISTEEYVSEAIDSLLSPGSKTTEYFEADFMKWAKENGVGDGYFDVSYSYMDGTSNTQTVAETIHYKENYEEFALNLMARLESGEITETEIVDLIEAWDEENFVARYFDAPAFVKVNRSATIHYYKKEQTKEYPLQIIGFNHDKVTDPYSYGKQKAGMTLQLGASRNVYGDTKPSLIDLPINGIMTADGKHYKSPNKVLADYAEGATNWAEGGFRIALQTLFDGTAIAPYLAEVQKYTSQYFNNTNKYYSPMLSNDKVFLPSEYEIFGLVSKSPGPEGEHYEFYKDGYSKFMWSDELLNGAVTGARVWLRSAAAEYTSKDTPNSIYGTSIYLGVYSLDPISLSYMPSGVASGESVAAYIAPCICL